MFARAALAPILLVYITGGADWSETHAINWQNTVYQVERNVPLFSLFLGDEGNEASPMGYVASFGSETVENASNQGGQKRVGLTEGYRIAPASFELRAGQNDISSRPTAFA